MNKKFVFSLVVLLFCIYPNGKFFAQNDTIRVMTYNVLHYGDGCQGSNSFLHSNLKTIVQFANPDILGMVKMQSIKLNVSDVNGISPPGFADSIIRYALDAAFPGRYSYCTLTNVSRSPDDDMDVLFYDQRKLGFVSVVNLCAIQEDFDLYKLYYKDPNLITTHDSTFLYFILNHTISGSSSSGRDQQDSIVVKGLKKIFYHLPNLVTMGDFNTRTSAEPGYELLTTTSDSSFLFYDPPFNLDHELSYPINWNSNSHCFPFLNVATRQSSSLPNACGQNGGAKDWYIHILLSPWIANNSDYVKYIPHSYTTLGNDGKRYDVSVNDSTTSGKNTSASPSVLNALFQLSDKYPILVKLGVTYNSTGGGPVNPVNSIQEAQTQQEPIKISNPVGDHITIHFPSDMLGKKVVMTWYDLTGRMLNTEELIIQSSDLDQPVYLLPGMYLLRLQSGEYSITSRVIKE